MNDDDKEFVAQMESEAFHNGTTEHLCRIIRELEGDLQELVSLRAQYFKLGEQNAKLREALEQIVSGDPTKHPLRQWYSVAKAALEDG